MPDDDKTKWTDELVTKGCSHPTKDHAQDAALSLQEASMREPDDSSVKEAWDALNAHGNESELVNLCMITVQPINETYVKNLVKVAAANDYTALDAERCIRLVLDQCRLHSTDKTEIISAISRSTNGAKGLAQMLQKHLPATFRDMWTLGDVCVDILVRTALMQELWGSEETRSETLRGFFTLFVTKLRGTDAKYQEVAMRSIARLIAADASALLPLIDHENLVIILSFLDVNRSAALKNQATLVVAKFLEAAPESGKTMLEDYVISRFTKASSTDVIAAISVAAAIFPIIPEMAAYVFLKPKVVEDLVCMASESSGHSLRQATLELLSAACVDRTCRSRIQKICVPWLEDILNSSSRNGNPAMAGLVLSKVLHGQIQESSDPNRCEETLRKVVSMFKDVIVNSTEAEIQTSVEGLAYSSIHANVKELLANDQTFLKNLMKILFDSPNQGPLLFGGMTIISHLTAYTQALSAEENRMAQMKAYASQMKFSEPHPNEDDMHVTKRCKSVIDAGVAAVLLKIMRQVSHAMLNVVASILLSLSHERNHCGIMVQQGLAGAILHLAHMDQPDAAGILLNVRRQSAHALAKILISVPPELFFTSVGRSVKESITLLNFLISHQELKDPYCAFDALRALTNIASFNEASARLISDSCFPSIAGYLQASRSAQQQAATECICNLSHSDYFLLSHYVLGSDEGDPFDKDFDVENSFTSPKEVQFQCLITLTGSTTRGTRIAAMGALAVIAGTMLGRRMLIRAPNGLENIMAAFTEGQTVEAGEAIGLTGEDAYLGDIDMRIRSACVVYEVCRNTEDIEIHRRLVRHGLMKLLTEGSKHLPCEKHVREQLVAYTEPIGFKLKEVFKR